MPYGQKSKTDTFILTLPLITNSHDEAVLYSNFEKYCKAYNWLVQKTTEMWHQVRKTRRYRELVSAIANTAPKSKERKALYKKRTELLESYGFTSVLFEKKLKAYAKYYHLHSAISQKIAARVWDAWYKFFYKNGKSVHYKKLDDFVSFAAKTNGTGIQFLDDNGLYIKFRGRCIPVKLRKGNTAWYQQEALKRKVKFCIIKREMIRGRWRYFVQLALDGYPPIKCDGNGVAKHPVEPGHIGIDIGTQAIAFSGKDVCDLRVLAPSAIAEARNGLTKEIARIMRQMDRSRRAMNPQYFNENGTVKRLKRKNGHKQIRHWNYSKNYYRLLHRLRDVNRKLAAVRKTEHYILANEMLTYGNEFYVEDMNYKALQKRSKKTKINPKTGRAYTKKRFGKSIGRCAPALFITILGQKASRYGGSVIKVSTFETKASQFDHTDDSYTKKKLSQRFAKLSNGTVVQRDMYSAFLLTHLDESLQGYDKEAIDKDFQQFMKLHNETKERLQNSHEWLPASVGF